MKINIYGTEASKSVVGQWSYSPTKDMNFSGNGGQPLLRGQVIPQDLSAGIEVCQDLQKAL